MEAAPGIKWTEAEAEARAAEKPRGVEKLGNLLLDERKRVLHLALLSILLLAHLSTHYATYFPPTRELLSGLPYFRLHSLHEAEFLVVIVYASLTFRVWGGIWAMIATAVTSVPFLLTPFIFGRAPRPDELRDLSIQLGIVLFMGALFTILYEALARERERRSALTRRLEASNAELRAKNEELERMNRMAEQSNRQMEALSRSIQGQINHLFGELREAVDAEKAVPLAGNGDYRLRHQGLLARVERVLR